LTLGLLMLLTMFH